MLQKKYIILLVIFLLLLVGIPFVFFTFNKSREKIQTAGTPTPFPTSVPTSNNTVTIKNTFTPQEEAYPTTPPQPLPSINTQTGFLVVESPQDDVRVIIDEPEEPEGAEGTASPNDQRVILFTPFRVLSIPVGEHTLTAVKPGYNYISQAFTIEPNKVTKVVLDITPLPTDGAFYPPEN